MLGQSGLLSVMGDERVQEVDALSDRHVASFTEDRVRDEHVPVGCCCDVIPASRLFDVYNCRKNSYA